MKIFARLLPKQFLLFFFLTFLLVACGGGGGSSGGSISALQGLWIQRDNCGCSLLDRPNPSDAQRRRCFFFFAGDRAVSGYLSSEISRCELSGDSYRRALTGAEATSIRNSADRVQKDNNILASELPGDITSPITAAAGTVFAVSGGSGGNTNINFIYGGRAGRAGGGRDRVCSIYNRDGSTLNLGRGSPGDTSQGANEQVCNTERYTTRDSYFSP